MVGAIILTAESSQEIRVINVEKNKSSSFLTPFFLLNIPYRNVFKFIQFNIVNLYSFFEIANGDSRGIKNSPVPKSLRGNRSLNIDFSSSPGRPFGPPRGSKDPADLGPRGTSFDKKYFRAGRSGPRGTS